MLVEVKETFDFCLFSDVVVVKLNMQVNITTRTQIESCYNKCSFENVKALLLFELFTAVVVLVKIASRLRRFIFLFFFSFNPFTPRNAKYKNSKDTQISFRRILKNKWCHSKVMPERFHLNSHTIGFHQQTQKLELHYIRVNYVSIIDYGSEQVKFYKVMIQ